VATSVQSLAIQASFPDPYKLRIAVQIVSVRNDRRSARPGLQTLSPVDFGESMILAAQFKMKLWG
jgi:hypothetical protein